MIEVAEKFDRYMINKLTREGKKYEAEYVRMFGYDKIIPVLPGNYNGSEDMYKKYVEKGKPFDIDKEINDKYLY